LVFSIYVFERRGARFDSGRVVGLNLNEIGERWSGR